MDEHGVVHTTDQGFTIDYNKVVKDLNKGDVPVATDEEVSAMKFDFGLSEKEKAKEELAMASLHAWSEDMREGVQKFYPTDAAGEPLETYESEEQLVIVQNAIVYLKALKFLADVARETGLDILNEMPEMTAAYSDAAKAKFRPDGVWKTTSGVHLIPFWIELWAKYLIQRGIIKMPNAA
jgi:hypothetical protein